MEEAEIDAAFPAFHLSSYVELTSALCQMLLHQSDHVNGVHHLRVAACIIGGWRLHNEIAKAGI
jgi:hypothetical protein